jgi:hypothetical protein
MPTQPPTASPPENYQAAWRRHRRFKRLGRILMLLGLVVAITHWLAHLQAFGPSQPPGWMDLAAGYPTGAVLVISGAILAGQNAPKR